MNIKQRIEGDLKAALLSGDKEKATTLRGLKSVILDAEIAEKKRDTGLDDDTVISLLVKEVKKRKESIELYQKAGAADKAAHEQQEVTVIETYLPEQMGEDELQALVDKTVSAMGEVSMQQMGQVIGKVKAEAGASADGSVIARLVKERLSQ